MKKLTRKNLDELAEIMPIVSEAAQCAYIGGDGGCKASCVFNCFDYLDGDLYDSCHYYHSTLENLGYEPNDSGGVCTSDIPAIGSYGGFHVQEVGSSPLHSDGTINGHKVIMTFNQGGIDHAVIVTGYRYENGSLRITYEDPTTGDTGDRANGNYSALYTVQSMYSGMLP